MTEPTQILNKLLKEIAIERNFVDYDVKVNPISSGGANYTSTLYEVTLSVGGKDIYMFAKVAAIGEKMRTQAPKMYKTENLVYTKLSKIYKRLEDEHQIPEEHRLTFAECYGCTIKPYEETIVLENLFKSGYEAYDRFKCMSKEYAYSSLTELAKLHALSFAYAEYYPKEFSEVAEELKVEWDMDSDMMAGYYKKVVDRAVLLTREENKKPLQNFFDEVPRNAFVKYMTAMKLPVLGHGDYRPSNLMHKNRDDGTVDIKIVDLQTMQASTPILDLLYFLFSGSDEKFRTQYYDKLIDHYYNELRAAMERFHLDPEKTFSRADFDIELKEKMPLGLILAVFVLPVVTVEEEHAPTVNEDLDLQNFSVDKTSDLYTERLNGLVNDFVKWGVLK